MIAGIGTIIGLGGGVIKDVIQVFADRSNKKLEAELEIKSFKEKQEVLLNFEREKGNINLELAQTEQETENLKTQGIKAQTDSLSTVEKEKTEQAWLSAIKESTGYIHGSGWIVNFSNFVIACIRPAISIYLLWFLYSIYKTSIAHNEHLIADFATYILTFTETILSFWFYARSSEKNFNFKKKI